MGAPLSSEDMLPPATALRLRCFPSDDGRFSEVAESALSSLPDEESEEALAAILRETYPKVRVSAQARLATLLPNERVWYVYRDGTSGRP
ncbi:MAG: hypothetical protein HYX57_01760 [Chloroflexi bacterium]|nr:hypothetical protein [Chloroflexota bacterium]